MSLIDFSVSLNRTNELLERIAIALERACPVPVIAEKRLRGPESIVDISPGAVTRRTNLDTFLDLQGISEGERAAAKQEINNLPDVVREAFLAGLDKQEEE